jgi:ElaB/YqjD/DUF883 family membrane-anchored ribosome-binding protein
MAQMIATLRIGRERLAAALRAMGQLQNASKRLGVAAGQTQAFARHVFDRAGEVQREKPLHFLAMVAGLALVAGIATRVWRGRADA